MEIYTQIAECKIATFKTISADSIIQVRALIADSSIVINNILPKEEVWNDYKFWQLFIASIGIAVALFVLFFKAWWDEKEKQNDALKEDRNRLLMFSSLLYLATKATLKIKESFSLIYDKHLADNEKFPERIIVIQKVSIDRLINLPDIESYLSSFNKIYSKSITRKDENTEIMLFNELIASFEWVGRFEHLFDKDYEYNYERYNVLYEQIISLRMKITEAIVRIQKEYKSNKELTKDLDDIIEDNEKVQTFGDLVQGLFKERMLNSKFIRMISDEARISLAADIIEIERCYDKMMRLTTGIFHPIPKIINDFEEIRKNGETILAELQTSLEGYPKPLKGGFFYKLLRYPFR